jgi:CDGSH-type Zn-finger protein
MARIVDADGNVIRAGDRIALCRCGHSRNAPFCDLSHLVAGFEG